MLAAASAPLSAQSDSWSAPIQLRMANPYFPTNTNPSDDFFAPIHATLGPGGQIMLFGYRQADLEVQGLQQHRRTGSMAAALHKIDLTNPPASGQVTLVSLGEEHDLSCGVRTNIGGTTPVTTPPNPNAAEFVESDPADTGKQIFVDRLFCSGHVPDALGRVIAVGGLRAGIRWARWDGAMLTPAVQSVGFGGGVPFVQRWDWEIQDVGWRKLAPLAGVGDDFPGPTQPSCLNWMPPSAVCATLIGSGIFRGFERYYPTATLMLDGLILIVGGQWFLSNEGSSQISPRNFLPPDQSKNLSVEIYDATGTSGSTTVLSNSTNPLNGGAMNVPNAPPEVFNPDYTHAFVLPVPFSSGGIDYDVLMLGEAGKPLGFKASATAAWFQGWTPRTTGSCPNDGASTVLLPLRLANPTGVNDFGYHNGAVLCVGGNLSAGAGSRIDVFDPRSGTGAWPPPATAFLAIARSHVNAVLLPDGTIVVIGGVSDESVMGSNDPMTKRAEYVTLNANGTLTVALGQSSMADFRAYHSVVLLLPDGRVFVGGGRQRGQLNAPFERADFTILSPPYMTVPRPQITHLERNVLDRQNDPTPATNPVLTTAVDVTMMLTHTPPSEAVLVSLGSMTHSFDMHQRHVQVALTAPVQRGPLQWTVTVTAPEYRWAPPGYYMLFVLGPNRIPSKAAMIRLQ